MLQDVVDFFRYGSCSFVIVVQEMQIIFFCCFTVFPIMCQIVCLLEKDLKQL